MTTKSDCNNTVSYAPQPQLQPGLIARNCREKLERLIVFAIVMAVQEPAAVGVAGLPMVQGREGLEVADLGEVGEEGLIFGAVVLVGCRYLPPSRCNIRSMRKREEKWETRLVEVEEERQGIGTDRG